MAHPAYITEPGPPKKYSDYEYDIEKQNQEALRKNNEELDKLCKKICTIIGWSLCCCLFLYIILLEISRK